ncbi:MAG: UDP-N-acetylmuramate dehydrogenase [Gemmiger sp.]
MEKHAIPALTAALREAGVPLSCAEPLSRHTTFRIGGRAAVFCEPETVPQLVGTLELCRRYDVPYYLLGNGSNTLFADEGYNGAVVSVGRPLGRITVSENTVFAGAGASLAAVCKAALGASLAGLEFAYGIPGYLGGAVYMNAGAYGGEMKDVVKNVTFLDSGLHLRTLTSSELEFGYRTSIFERQHWCILEAELCLTPGDSAQIHAQMEELMARRKEKQPLDYPSAGSTFKRPQGAFAGKLIQDCGLAGFRVGGAAVSTKHCGFVVNLGGATCADVVELTEQVKQIVQQRTGYTLEREIRVVK